MIRGIPNFEKDLFTIDNYLAGVLEHDRYARTDPGLDLTDAPIRFRRMRHKHAGGKEVIGIAHENL